MLVCLSAAAIAQKAPPAKPFERFDGCVLEPDEWTDGDSFRVRLPDGRFETFRLYFVDTTESRSHGKRSDEQAAYFGLTRAQAIELGRQAKKFTANALTQPFTIYTRWRSVSGPTRYYAIVVTAGRDLNELLVSSGLARIYGTPHRCQTVGTPANISRICTNWKMRPRLRSAADGVWCSRDGVRLCISLCHCRAITKRQIAC